MATRSGTQRNGFPESGYRAFLLRCWQEMGTRPEDEPVWRFALMQAGDHGSGRAFANLEALVAFLQMELRRGAEKGS